MHVQNTKKTFTVSILKGFLSKWKQSFNVKLARLNKLNIIHVSGVNIFYLFDVLFDEIRKPILKKYSIFF
jgi:hypothetical protein